MTEHVDMDAILDGAFQKAGVRVRRRIVGSTRYTVTGLLKNNGVRKHVIRARSEAAAWERFCAAYSKHECSIVKIAKLEAA